MTFMQGHALVIAVANYVNIKHLPVCVLNDGRDVYKLLINPEKCGYAQQNVKTLLDQNATRENILAELASLSKRAKEDDTVLLFFSGHGGRITQNGIQKNYLLPYDASSESLDKTALSGDTITEILRTMKSARLLVIFDCCHSGGTAEPKTMFSTFDNFKSGLSDEYYDVLKRGNGRVIIASSLSNEESLVLSGMKNSLFTHYLLLGLSGAAESRNDGVIRVLDLFHFLSEKVPEHDHRQHPIIKAEAENNFPISLYKGGKTKTELAEKISQTPAQGSKYQAGRDIIAPESSITQINITNRD